MERALDHIDRLARAIGIALVAAIVCILAAQIFFRYALNSSLTWSEEVATWSMVWIVYIGSAAIMRRWEHVNIPMFIRWLPLGARIPAIVLAKLVTLATVAFIAWQGIRMVQGGFHIRSESVGMSTVWIKYAVPVGMVLMALFALACVADDLRRWRRGDRAYFARYGELTGADARESAPGS